MIFTFFDKKFLLLCNYSATIFLRVSDVNHLGFCKRIVAEELICTYSRVPNNQQFAAYPRNPLNRYVTFYTETKITISNQNKELLSNSLLARLSSLQKIQGFSIEEILFSY